MKKRLALVLAVLMALSVLTYLPALSEGASEEPVEIFYVDRYGAHDWDSTVLWKVLEEKFNVKITRKSYAAVDGSTWFTLAILSGDTPAYISDMSSDDMTNYARQGLFKPLDMEMIKEYAPNMYEWWNNEWIENWTDFATVDGTLYGVPVLWSLSNNWNTVAIREDICNELGVEVPHTIDALEEFMAKAKETYNMDYVMSMSGDSYLDFVLGAYDVYRNGFYLGNDNELYWWTNHPNAKEAVGRLADWYAKGYIDPEFLTNDAGMVTERWASGKSLIGLSYWCDFVEAGTWGSADGAMLAALKEANPEAKVAWVGTPTSDKGNGGWISDPWCGWFVFSNELSDEQMIKYLQCFDYCSQTLEGLLYANKGIEGEHYSVDDENNFTWLEAADTAEKREALGIGINFPENFNNYTAQYPFSTSNSMTENRHFWEDNNYTRSNILAAASRELWADWGTAFKDYCNKNFIDFVTGARDIEEWDAFITEVNTQYHGTELIAEAEEKLASLTSVVDKYAK